MAEWHFGFGDSTPLGWFITLAYALSSIACFAAARRSRMKTHSLFWLFIAIVMLLFCVNKQLDVQSLLTEEGRKASLSQGWFAWRRAIQAAFVLVLVSFIILVGIFVQRWSRPLGRSAHVALAGLGLIASFAILRASLFCHLSLPELVLRFAAQGAELLEASGILLVIAAATFINSDSAE